MAIAEFDLKYESAKAVKAQVFADLVVQHGGHEGLVEPVPLRLLFDGSICKYGCGIGIVIVTPKGTRFEFSFPVEAYTNNQVEYEAVLKGLQLLREANADFVEVVRDSLLIGSSDLTQGASALKIAQRIISEHNILYSETGGDVLTPEFDRFSSKYVHDGSFSS